MTVSKSLRALALAAVLPLAVGGCAGAQLKGAASSQFEDAQFQADELMRAREARRAAVAGPIITDAPYVDVTPIQKVAREPLSFSRVVTFSSAGEMPLHVFAKRIEGMTGLKVRYQHELLRGSVAPAGGGSTSPLVVSGITLPSVDSTIMGPSSLGPSGSPGIRINYSGTVRGLLEQVAEQTGAHWTWDATRQVVDFYKYETEAFRVAAVQGSGRSSFELGGAQSSSSEGGQSSLKLADTEASHETPASVWTEISDTVQKLISAEGTYQVNQIAGAVVVRDRPDRMQLVRDYFSLLNETLSRQVDIEVTIYRVNVNDRDFKGVSWDALFQTLINTSNYNIAWNSIRPNVVAENASSAVIRIPELTADGSPNRYANSQLFLDALSTIGRTAVVQSTSVLTSNNRAAPAKFVRRSTYLAETVPTYASGGGTSVGTGAGLTPGSVETGLNLYLLPHVQDDGKRMLLRAMVSISTLDSMEEGSSGEQTIQLPQVSSREFAQEAWLTSGETLVLTGYNQTDSGNTTRSPFGRFWGLGGERTISHGQELMVIAITPVVSASRSQI